MSEIYDTHLMKDGKKLKKFHLMFIDGDKSTCDCCDEQKERAVMSDLLGNAWGLCKDCLMKIVKEFN